MIQLFCAGVSFARFLFRGAAGSVPVPCRGVSGGAVPPAQSILILPAICKSDAACAWASHRGAAVEGSADNS